jgi:hypothetical protein
MSEQTLTVGDVLFPAGWDAQPGGEPQAMRDVHEAIKKEIKAVDLGAVKDALLKKLSTMLDDPLIKAFAVAWSKYSEIVKYRDRENYPPDDTFLVSLGEHTISSEYKPSIQVMINTIVVGTLEFAVTLAIEVKAFELEIRDAKIRRVRTGTWQGSGDVALEGKQIYSKQLDPVRLPGVVDLGDGVAIGA